MRILVIGGTGFIGPYVVRRLAGMGHSVAVFHRGNTQADLPAEHIFGGRQDLPKIRPDADVVIDLILSSGMQAQAFMEAFRGVAQRVVAASSIDVYRACGILHGTEEGPLEPVPLTENSRLRSKAQMYPPEALKMIVAASSMDVYRACGVLHGSEDGPVEPVPLTEESPLRTKLQTYPPAQIKMLQKLFGWLDDAYDKIPVERAVLGDPELPGTVLRLPMIYGPGDHLHRFHPVLKRIDDGRRVMLLEEGLAAWRAPRGYVENVAAALALAATSERAAGRIYNVAETPAFSELEWARKIAAAAGWDGQFMILPKERAPAHLVMPGNAAQHWEADSTRIREEIGYL